MFACHADGDEQDVRLEFLLVAARSRLDAPIVTPVSVRFADRQLVADEVLDPALVERARQLLADLRIFVRHQAR